jgi:hypothetical protein
MSAALRLEPQARIFNVSGGASESPLQNLSTREFLGSLRRTEGLQPEVAELPECAALLANAEFATAPSTSA